MNLATLSSGELATKYNKAATTLGTRTVKKFADRKTAIRRTEEILIKLKDHSAPPKKGKKGKTTKAERKKRGMRFVFPFNGQDDLRSSLNTKTLRGQCVDLLRGGAKFSKVEALVEKYDRSKGRKSHDVERRAYELVRIMHYYLGYGINHDTDGTIKLHTRPVG